MYMDPCALSHRFEKPTNILLLLKSHVKLAALSDTMMNDWTVRNMGYVTANLLYLGTHPIYSPVLLIQLRFDEIRHFQKLY